MDKGREVSDLKKRLDLLRKKRSRLAIRKVWMKKVDPTGFRRLKQTRR